jgi:molecular chaperone HtpG
VPGSRPFQVDLRGVVDLLSRHIYSSPRVYLRELLQNGVDAITARRELGVDSPNWGIRVYPRGGARDEFILTDDGIGLTAVEVVELLATVGRTSKRDIFDMPRSDYLGQFGIGLLSCFMVADTIRIRSQSASGGKPVEWVGSADGTFSVREIDESLPVGTSVYLTPRFDTGELLSQASAIKLAGEFGEYLPVPVCVDTPGETLRLNRDPVFLREIGANPGELFSFGRELIGGEPLDVIDISVPGVGIRGKAFVLPYAPAPNAHQATRVYLGRMLLSERLDGVLPDWAFFVRAVIDSDSLTPTASREALVEDFRLEHAREELGNAIRRWLIDLSMRDPHRMGQFLAVHESALKQLVLHDDDLAGFVTKQLSVETSLGRMRVERLVENPVIRYAETLDEFSQVVGIAREDSLIVNGGYLWDADLVRLLPTLFDVQVERIDVLSELDQLDPPPLDDRTVALALEERGTAALEGRDCQVVVRIMGQPETPALFVADPEVFRRIDRGRARGVASPLWDRVLGQVDEVMSTARGRAAGDYRSRMCLNWGNQLVRSLARLQDDAVFDRCVQLLYAQSQLAGHRPLTRADRKLLHAALADLIALRVGVDQDLGLGGILDGSPETE